jgi:hypothetical protein
VDHDGKGRESTAREMLLDDLAHVELAADGPAEAEHAKAREIDCLGEAGARSLRERPARLARERGSVLNQLVADALAPATNLVPVG